MKLVRARKIATMTSLWKRARLVRNRIVRRIKLERRKRLSDRIVRKIVN